MTCPTIRVQMAFASEVGGCNFCTRGTENHVWVVGSNDEHRHLEVRICSHCLADVLKQISEETPC